MAGALSNARRLGRSGSLAQSSLGRVRSSGGIRGTIPTYGVAWGGQGGDQGSLHRPKARLAASAIALAVMKALRYAGGELWSGVGRAFARPVGSSGLLAGLVRRRARIRLSARTRLAVVAPVSLGRRIVGAEVGAEHDQGPLARLVGCLGWLHACSGLAGCTGLAGCADLLCSAPLLRTALFDCLATDFCFKAGFSCATAGFSSAGAGFCSTTAGFASGTVGFCSTMAGLSSAAADFSSTAAGLSCATIGFASAGAGAGFCSTMAGLASVAADFSSTAAGLSCAIAGFSSAIAGFSAAGAGFSSTVAGLSSAADGFSSAAAAGVSCAGTEGCAAVGLGLSVADVCASA